MYLTMRNHNKLNTTDMSQPVYTYRPVDFDTDAIRLVRLFKGRFADPIECEFFETWLHDVSFPYEALSYAWGGTLKTAKVTLSGCALEIAENLYDALQYLRWDDKDRIVWIDAICINQDNMEERGHQVSQMKSIYKTAQRVIIWLGLSSYNIDRLMGLAIMAHGNVGATREYWRQVRVRWHIMTPIEHILSRVVYMKNNMLSCVKHFSFSSKGPDFEEFGSYKRLQVHKQHLSCVVTNLSRHGHSQRSHLC